MDAIARSVVRGRTEIVHLLLDCGASVDAQDYEGRTPFQGSSCFKDRSVFTVLENR